MKDLKYIKRKKEIIIMKKTLKSNKGFSLVELIVVVLIMAIIAVALAPQIMKWVGHSRTSTDASTYDTLYENVQLALTDETVLGKVTTAVESGDITVTMDKDGVEVSNADLETKLDEIGGSNWKTKTKQKDTSGPESGYVITIKKGVNGAGLDVEKTTSPDGEKVKQ